MRTTIFAALLAPGLFACSLLLDFESTDGLPCECLPDYVCLIASDQCVKKGSTDDFKSCSLDARNPDDLCKPGSICADRGDGMGPRCLRTCTLTNFATRESSANIAAQCPRTTLCFPFEDTAVCAEGECADLSDDCGAERNCVSFNGAGKCFTICRIFDDVTACVGQQACHPLGISSVTGCINAGVVPAGEICSDQTPCMQRDSLNRPLVCDRTEAMGPQAPNRCFPICKAESMGQGECVAGEICQFSRQNIDTGLNVSLGLCVRS